jgi:hypothetical protein
MAAANLFMHLPLPCKGEPAHFLEASCQAVGAVAFFGETALFLNSSPFPLAPNFVVQLCQLLLMPAQSVAGNPPLQVALLAALQRASESCCKLRVVGISVFLGRFISARYRLRARCLRGPPDHQ